MAVRESRGELCRARGQNCTRHLQKSFQEGKIAKGTAKKIFETTKLQKVPPKKFSRRQNCKRCLQKSFQDGKTAKGTSKKLFKKAKLQKLPPKLQKVAPEMQKVPPKLHEVPSKLHRVVFKNPTGERAKITAGCDFTLPLPVSSTEGDSHLITNDSHFSKVDPLA